MINDLYFFSSLGLDVDDEDEAPAEHVEAPAAAAEAVSSSAIEEIDCVAVCLALRNFITVLSLFLLHY